MIKEFERLLFEKTKDSPAEILYAQWCYDKKLLPTALATISNFFPHYSLHDETHSISILNNILRIVGHNTLEQMSSVDLWLLLEAAFYHDIGMVISSADLQNILTNNDFLSFFQNTIDDSKNTLHKYAKNFHIKNGKVHFNETKITVEILDSIKFMLAEYFRSQHSERSESIIQRPFETLAIESPRTVIPHRIIKILGDICRCHTQAFKSVLNLPFRENGIDIEDAHPRYIASLLRLGDLFDLDNDRFSEIILRTVSHLPIDSIHHKMKHFSIEHFRVDTSKIEVKALCTNYSVASITYIPQV